MYDMTVEIEPFGSRYFTTKCVYFGLYSRSGINVRLGCSFVQDYFKDGQLEISQAEKDKKNDVEYDLTSINVDEADIKKILTPGLKHVERQRLMKKL